MTEFHVGQEVLIRSVNERGNGPTLTTVTKVGRKLVYALEYGRERAFRIGDGSANDRYGHEWLQTPEEYQESQRRETITRELTQAFRTWSRIPTEKLERILAIMDED